MSLYDEFNKVNKDDEHIKEICEKFNYQLISKASKNIVYFKNDKGELVIVDRNNLANYDPTSA